LRDDGLLVSDPTMGRWQWDLERIVERSFTDNLADFMIAKIARLPEATRAVMKRLACLGRSAETEILARVAEQDEPAVHRALAEAVAAGLPPRGPPGYEFPHDRVQEATYALTVETERGAIHHRAGQVLIAVDAASRRDELLFETVSHFNRAGVVLAPDEQREV